LLALVHIGRLSTIQKGEKKMKGELILTSVCTLTITDPNERHGPVGDVTLLGILQGAREGLVVLILRSTHHCLNF
jgi:hypothetical protein